MRERDIPHPRSSTASVSRVRHMLVSRSAAEAVNVDASRSTTVAVVNVPVSADQETRVHRASEDRVAPPHALHITTSSVVCREAAHNAHTGDRMRLGSHTKGGHIPSLARLDHRDGFLLSPTASNPCAIMGDGDIRKVGEVEVDVPCEHLIVQVMDFLLHLRVRDGEGSAVNLITVSDMVCGCHAHPCDHAAHSITPTV